MDNNQSVPQAVVAQPTLPPSSPTQPPVSSQAGSWYKAGLVRRYLAALVDSVLFIPVQMIFYIVSALFMKFPGSVAIEGPNDHVLLPALLRLGFLTLLPSLLFVAYNIFCVWKYGATIGKKLLKVKVINQTGQPLRLSQVIIRETVGKFSSSMVLNLGYLWAIWDKKRQTWHDKLGKTLVVTTVPNDGKNPWWYYLALILPFISILAVLAAIVVLAVNPIDLTRRSKDAVRLSDLTNLNMAIEIAKAQDLTLNPCGSEVVPCEGDSRIDDLGDRNINGTGWVKVDLSKVELTPKMLSLPIDPTNSSVYYYRYCSDGRDWEINAKLESDKSKVKMEQDGGDDSSSYEVGTNLNLCPQSRFIRIDEKPIP